MTKTITRIGTGLVTVAMLASVAAPAFAATVTVTGNGRNSHNTVNVHKTNTNVATQTSNTGVHNTVYVSQNSGGNKSHDNLGDSTITSGHTNSNVNLSVTGGSNVLTAPTCGCDTDDTVVVAGNLRNSHNTVNLNNSQTNVLSQTSNTSLYNFVGVSQNTGGNTSHDNLGDSTITSGNANSNVNTVVDGGSNVAQ